MHLTSHLLGVGVMTINQILLLMANALSPSGNKKYIYIIKV